jgi:hypothetical protein
MFEVDGQVIAGFIPGRTIAARASDPRALRFGIPELFTPIKCQVWFFNSIVVTEVIFL